MSQVLDIDTLLDSPLADLHALAGELGIESYRLMRKSDLTVAILVNRGMDEAEVRPAADAKYAQLQAVAAERADAEEAAAAEAERERRAAERERRDQARPRSNQREGRGRRGEQSRGRDRRPRDRSEGSEQAGDRKGRDQSARERSGRDQGSRDRQREAPKPKEAFAVTGVFEPRQGGAGMLRARLAERSKDDVEVGRNDVRKYRLYRGDAVVGEAAKSRRGRSAVAGTLVSVTSVNDVPADQLGKRERVRFDAAESVPAADRLAKRLFKAAPFGRGSGVLIVGPSRGASSELAANVAAQLAKDGVATTLAIAAAPPGGDTAGSGYDVIAGSLDGKSNDFIAGIELAVERGKRIAESGGDAAVIVDGIDLLPEGKRRAIFQSARNLAQHGSLTIVASSAPGTPLEAVATTIAVVSAGRKVKVDKKQSWSSFGR